MRSAGLNIYYVSATCRSLSDNVLVCDTIREVLSALRGTAEELMRLSSACDETNCGVTRHVCVYVCTCVRVYVCVCVCVCVPQLSQCEDDFLF